MSSKPKVFITRQIPTVGLDKLRDACQLDIWPDDLPPSHDALLERVKGCAGLLTLVTDPIDAAVMDAGLPDLKIISQMAVGYDNIDLKAAQERGIPVGNTPGVLTDATADLTFALLLAAARRLPESIDYVKAGQWQTWGPLTLLGHDLHRSTLGIIGLGRIGQAVARRAQGFGMRIIVHSPSATAEKAEALGVELASLEDLLKQSDFVSLHVPFNDKTRHLINAAALHQMKNDAVLINTARGGVVDQAALVAALEAGEIGGAALDVTDPEPLPADHPLVGLPNVIVLPHIGSAGRHTRDLMASIAADNLLAGLRGDPLPHEVT